ncbi:MAG: hypothetical protein DWP95_06015 [Proteobacteria bacterium]|nr:MAG: hypothetical protein DWP95_06015 [Pseudomonadota bacterium]
MTLDLIILDTSDCPNLAEVKNWKGFVDIKPLVCGSTLFNYFDQESVDLQNYQKKNPIEYSDRLCNDPDFENKAIKIIERRDRIFKKAESSNLINRFYTYPCRYKDSEFVYRSFKRYTALPFMSIDAVNYIKINEKNIKKRINQLNEWLSELSYQNKIEIENQYSLWFSNLDYFEIAEILCCIIKSNLNRGFDIN